MVHATDKYRDVHFTGVQAAPVGSRDAWMRPMREAPSASIFAKPFVTHAPVISPADRSLLDDIFGRYKLNLNAYRPRALGRRIPACLRALQARSPLEAQRRLELDEHAVEPALDALLIGVTAFFRDAPVFAHLQHTALPALLRESPEPRVLCVGCSEGAEVYSAAICLEEAGAASYAIRAMDCRTRAIRRGKAGVYASAALAPVAAELRAKYFERSGSQHRVKDAVRAHIHWQHADAFIHLPSGPHDLIFCRNFAIYLTHAAAARLWRRLHNALRPGGLLMTGKAEHPTSGFVRAGPCLYRKATP